MIFSMSIMVVGENNTKVETTKFTDVDESNPYSGYIDYLTEIGIVSGVSESLYSPQSNVTAEMAYKVMVSILGYNQIAEQLGGYPEGYAKVADILGFTTNLSFKEQYLTRDGALKIAHYVLTNCFDELLYFSSNGEITVTTDSKNEFAVLGDRHKINVYTGYVESVPNTGYVNIRIDGNKYDTNPEMLAKGYLAKFEANDKNLREFEGTNVTVWVNDENKIVYIALKRKSDIKYGYIYSVNGITNAEGIPSIASLEELTLINDEEDYDISQDVKVRYNGKIVTDSVKLEGNFARLVFQNDEITFIETWDLKEAGLITEMSAEYIQYTKGVTPGLRLKDLDQYKNKRFYIDNAPAGEGHIKADVVFDYYASGDDLVIVASEKKIVDEFYSYSSSTVEIGDSIYKYKNLYYSDGAGFKADDGFINLISTDVSAYIGPDGYVRYIKLNDLSKLTNRTFYGVVDGVNTDVFNEEAEIKVWVYGDEIVKQTLKVNEKTRFLDGLSIEELGRNAKNVSGNGVYLFTLNAKGNVSEIEKPIPFYGYGVDITEKDKRVSQSITTMDSDTNAYIPVSYQIPNDATDDPDDLLSISKRLYFKNAPMMALFNKDGVFTVEKTSQSAIIGKSGMSVTLTFFGDENKSPLPSMVLLTGDLSSLGSVYTQYGILTEKSIVINNDGEERVDLYITKGDSTPRVYSVTKEYAATLPDYALLAFFEETVFSENDINVTSIISLEGNPSNWELTSTENQVGLHEGKFERIESKRLYLEDTAYYMHPGTSGKPIVRYTENGGKRTIQVIDAAEIMPGDYVYYYLASGGLVRAVIVAD